MGRVVVSTYVTLDGVMEAPEEWSLQFFDEEAMGYAQSQLFASDALLLGRVTYEGFAAAWGELEDPGINPIAERRGTGKICGSECHALLPARRVADHAHLRYRLGRGQVLGPHPGGRTPGVQRRWVSPRFPVCTHIPDQPHSRRAS